MTIIGNVVMFSGVICHEGQQSDWGHYTSGVQTSNTWLSISDTRVLRQKKFQCNLRDLSDPYTQIDERRNDTRLPLSILNNAAGIRISSELIADSTPGIMIQQSVIRELGKQKTKINVTQKKGNTTKHVIYPVRKKSKFTIPNFREIDENKKEAHAP